MSVLVDSEIITQLGRASIIIEPFHRKHLGTNSYDVHLAPTLRVYKTEHESVKRVTVGQLHGSVEYISDEIPLDVRVPRGTVDINIDQDVGHVLKPGELYLASTVEYTESHEHLPILNGKSSLGRLGLSIHVTAGTGDVGFRGHWTLELHVVKPLRIYAGMAVGQLLWFTASGPPEVPYDLKPSAKYGGRDLLPQASKMHQEHARAPSED
jgi:dCTP deaminase